MHNFLFVCFSDWGAQIGQIEKGPKARRICRSHFEPDQQGTKVRKPSEPVQRIRGTLPPHSRKDFFSLLTSKCHTTHTRALDIIPLSSPTPCEINEFVTVLLQFLLIVTFSDAACSICKTKTKNKEIFYPSKTININIFQSFHYEHKSVSSISFDHFV